MVASYRNIIEEARKSIQRCNELRDMIDDYLAGGNRTVEKFEEYRERWGEWPKSDLELKSFESHRRSSNGDSVKRPSRR